jgi:MFS-type transporter involved in bile tolerance (Atg22 family)
MVMLLPHVPSRWTIPVFVIYGFFFMSSYPMTEAALMESVPDAVRGRVFGLFLTVGGLIGNLSHWVVGAAVKGIGAAAYSPSGYYSIYGALGLMMALSVAGLPCLHAIRKREEEIELGHVSEVSEKAQPAQ